MATALAVAGLPTGRFAFEGFLSMNKRSRRAHLDSLRAEPRTMVFYEAPDKLLSTLEDLLGALGDRRIALVRELTKIHEEVVRTTLAEAVERYTQNPPRGEFVLVVEGAAPTEQAPMTLEQAEALAREYMAQGMSPSEAAKTAAAETGLKKGDVYRRIID
jgi:16S rRNA (cytidine1402-2'-O)-methyltransferase